MWEYLGSDFAFDLVKGLVAGCASLAFQVVAPRMLRAVKQLRARWRAGRGAARNTSAKEER
ncbi:hypothetical protein GCM10007857_71430 [Bradyrhizobium iriomotense]|uniref:Uncharacterized protein n=1 Tax=Bradyrhizobium iriomotense TaxID=441950 RepID=A0ABQ6BE28_9BRAD|nr:hypothetical protein GCM10007857_71430 [Bradyrhizobium iriomotense]